jgi:hypothetical protein
MIEFYLEIIKLSIYNLLKDMNKKYLKIIRLSIIVKKILLNKIHFKI